MNFEMFLSVLTVFHLHIYAKRSTFFDTKRKIHGQETWRQAEIRKQTNVTENHRK